MFAGLVANFQTGDILEFRQALNAHQDADVRASAGNVSFTVAPQTQGAVRSFKKFREGRYALELELRNGPYAGRRAWFFYNSERPSMKLYAASAPRPEAVVAQPEQARSATTVTRAPAMGEAKEEGLDRLIASVMKAADGPEIDKENCSVSGEDAPEEVPIVTPVVAPVVLQAELAPEPIVAPSVAATATASPRVDHVPTGPSETGNPAKYEESKLMAPLRDAHSGTPASDFPCRWHTHDSYEVCLEKDTGAPRTFGFTNTEGESESQPHHRREWEFLRSESARQELEFRVIDKYDERTSTYEESYIRIFPRRVLPAVRQEGEIMNVTLPTGETVRFDARTKKIVDGVLAEKPVTRGKVAGVEYHGSGVILRADRRGDDARTGSVVAKISKPHCAAGEQCRICEVPVKKLWGGDAENPSFRFPTDAQFDEFVKKTCGFSIY